MAKFIRDAAAEARAIERGTATAAEIEKRGGVNKSGYYGDSFNPEVNLSDEEYAAAVAKGGGIEVNAATQARQKAVSSAKLKAKFMADGLSEADAQKKVDELYANLEAGQSVDANGNVITSSAVSATGLKTDAQIAAELASGEKKAERQSAYDLLYSQFKQYGLESLIEPLKGLIVTGVSPSEFTIKLRETPAYQKRFAANAKRIANGFAAIDEATYLALEDKYQSIMQNYGLPASYYAKGEMGVQQGFEDLIGGNVDAVTLEERILEGQKVLKGNKLILDAAKKFFPELTDADFLGYVLNPKNALSDIKRKVTAAEIGGAQLGAGLEATAAGAEALVAAGVTGQRYQQAAPTIAEAATRGSQLASMFGESPYTQQTAEQAILNVPGSAEALKQTKKLTALEQAEFSKKSGVGILSRERAGIL
jgi:hypothetical protein